MPMNRLFSTFSLAALAIASFAPSALAAVNVERVGSENAVLEVAKSAIYGGLGGLVVGGAIALMDTNNNNAGDIWRWGFITGTLFGLGYGIYHVANRPAPSALIEWGGGAVRLHPVLPVPDRAHGLSMRLIAVAF